MTDEFIAQNSGQNIDRVAEESGSEELQKTSVIETIEYKQEETRALLAKRLVGIFFWTIILTFSFIVIDQVLIVIFHDTLQKSFELSKEIITIIWTSEAALLGSALGFYFSNRS